VFYSLDDTDSAVYVGQQADVFIDTSGEARPDRLVSDRG
jgi:hypothetical protein